MQPLTLNEIVGDASVADVIQNAIRNFAIIRLREQEWREEMERQGCTEEYVRDYIKRELTEQEIAFEAGKVMMELISKTFEGFRDCGTTPWKRENANREG